MKDETPSPPMGALAFGPFLLDPRRRTLTADGRPVELGARAFDILTVLARHASETVSKRAIMEAAWGGIAVGEESLRFHIHGLRKALATADGGGDPIRTVAGRGYALGLNVERVQPLAGVVGREDIVAEVGTLLAHRRLVTLVGPGGVGKTTVAKTVSLTLGGDGAWIDFAATERDEAVAATALAALGGNASTRDPVAELVAMLGGAPRLLVFDCCERVADGVARLAERILAETGARLLATSRERLRAADEQVVIVPPLAAPDAESPATPHAVMHHDATRLLVERATRLGTGFALDADTAPLVAELCRRLDGLPLAIEIAAAHVVAFGLDQILALVRSGPGLQDLGPRTVPDRQRGLRATFEWSYALLGEPERRTLERLSVFEGAVSFDAALGVIVDDDLPAAAATAAIGRLADTSLLQIARAGQSASLRLLDTIRFHAAARLEARGEADTVRARLAEYMIAEVERSRIEGDPDRAGLWLGGICPNIANLRAAFRWASSAEPHHPLACRIAAAALPLLLQLSLAKECGEWARDALPLAEAAGEDGLVARLLAYLGSATLGTLGPTDEALAELRGAMAAGERQGDRASTGLVRSGLFWLYMYRGDGRLALAEAEAFGGADRQGIAVRERFVGMALAMSGEHRLVTGRYAAALTRPVNVKLGAFIRVGSDTSARSKMYLARSLWLSGRGGDALALYRATRESLSRPEQRLHLAHSLYQVILPMRCFLGEWEAAREAAAEFRALMPRQETSLRYQAAGLATQAVEMLAGGAVPADFAIGLDLLRHGRFTVMLPWLEGAQAATLLRAGDGASAAAVLTGAIAFARQTGNGWWLPELLRLRGEAHARLDDAAGAEADLTTALTLARKQGAAALETRICETRGRIGPVA